jgi:3-hydroxyisobutyrate dehydrogenase-like beta-hydroxyacid dehydrogenase
MQQKIGVIGAGLMGAAISRQLLKLGHTVTVWNRTPEKCEPLRAAGAAVVQDPRELVIASDLVVAIISSTGDVRQSLMHAGEHLRGRVVLNLIAGSPAQIRDLGSFVMSAGAAFMSGTIQCYPSSIGQPESTIICGGGPGAWERFGEVIIGLAGSSYYTGSDCARPHIIDASVTGGFLFTAIAACLEAASYAKKEGLPIPEFRDLVRQYLAYLPNEIEKVLDAAEGGKFATTDATLNTYLGALELFQTAFDNAGAPSLLLSANLERMKRAVGAGDGQSAFAALFRH